MTKFKSIKPEEISKDVFTMLDKDWALLTAGNKEAFNTMTIAWGGFGVLWNKKVCFTFVRPSRYTYDFTEKFNEFTLSFFNEKCRNALQICGTKSGRDGDKVKEAGLTPIHDQNNFTWFNEAELVIKCKKIYFQDLQPEKFLIPEIEKNYNGSDYHRMYVGEIVDVLKK